MSNLVQKVCEKCQGEAHEIIGVTEKNEEHQCLACGYKSTVVLPPKQPLTQQPQVTVKK